MSNDSNNMPKPASPTGQRLRPRAIALGLLLGAVAGLIAVVFFLVFASRHGQPILTRAEFTKAVEHWDKKGPRNYNLDLVLAGSQSGDIHVEVRDGQVARMTRDGIEPSQKRTWDYWSVPGQLDIIGEDLEAAEQETKGTPTKNRPKLVLRAKFDPNLGYPVTYHRVELGNPADTRWEITRFEILP